MSDKKEIKILFIDNNKMHVEHFSKVKEVHKNPDNTSTKIEILNGEGRFFPSQRSKEEQQKEIKKHVDENIEELDILLLDLILRKDEEYAIDNLYLKSELLSLEIARHYEQEFANKGKLIGFTSNHGSITTKSQFEEFKKMNGGKVGENWLFVMKPKFYKDDSPRPKRPCPELCKFKEYYRKIECNYLECIHHQLVSWF